MRARALFRSGRRTVDSTIGLAHPRVANVERAIRDVALGRMVILDADSDDSQAALLVAAERVTADDINFMTRRAGGWICLSLTAQRCDQLALPPMIEHHRHPTRSRAEAAFTVTIEARVGVTSGISTHDQARTMHVAADPTTTREDLTVPGHVQPLRARRGGVLERRGPAEAAVDLARLAGCAPAGVVCAIRNDAGSMARVEDLDVMCGAYGFTRLTVTDLVAYHRRVEHVAASVIARPSALAALKETT